MKIWPEFPPDTWYVTNSVSVSSLQYNLNIWFLNDDDDLTCVLRAQKKKQSCCSYQFHRWEKMFPEDLLWGFLKQEQHLFFDFCDSGVVYKYHSYYHSGLLHYFFFTQHHFINKIVITLIAACRWISLWCLDEWGSLCEWGSQRNLKSPKVAKTLNSPSTQCPHW